MNGAIKFLPVGRDNYAIVDEEDLEKIPDRKWGLDRGYPRIVSKNKKIYLHRLLMGFPSESIDHINHDKLDNRKSNLRPCSLRNNAKNQPKPKNNRSGYVGVAWDKSMKRWEAYLHADRKKIHVGYFDDARDGARARDALAKKIFGEFANLNYGEEK